MASTQKITRQTLIQELKHRYHKKLSRLSKDDLLTLYSNIMDDPVVNINVPVLTPTPFKEKTVQTINKIQQQSQDLFEYINNCIPEPIKDKAEQVGSIIHDKWKSVKELVKRDHI